MSRDDKEPTKQAIGKPRMHSDFLAVMPDAAGLVAFNTRFGNTKHKLRNDWLNKPVEMYLDAATRHVATPFAYDKDSGLIHLVPAAWSLMAALQICSQQGEHRVIRGEYSDFGSMIDDWVARYGPESE